MQSGSMIKEVRAMKSRQNRFPIFAKAFPAASLLARKNSLLASLGSVVPALIDPPGLGAPVEDWVAYRAGLDDLEARLCVDHPDLDWWPALQKIKR
jgi:hypothetical protein